MPNRATVIPLSTVLAWARDRQLTEVVIVGRDTEGKLHIGSTHGDGPSLQAMLQGAIAGLEKGAERATEAAS